MSLGYQLLTSCWVIEVNAARGTRPYQTQLGRTAATLQCTNPTTHLVIATWSNGPLAFMVILIVVE
ncbi:hypothetical protein K435DRAFT_859747 [Dendrothele bispora CBS 962.96]|uniref:Uncharacterized protein n=1 Tax=Dendrothele bispora (strain CBS 962.96) TaxID=1314807 RepID=A0A4S8LZN2_DENBC|nr:hypothetical protein K435DRAFT_859747 [Dendrothele bispora CBS 962.96]